MNRISNVNEHILKSAKEIREIEKIRKDRRLVLNITKEKFWKLYKLEAEKIIVRRLGKYKPFIVDQDNSIIIKQIFQYITCDPEFETTNIIDGYPEKNLSKGLMLIGSFGVGKSILIESLCNMINNIDIHNIEIRHAKELPDLITHMGVGFYKNRRLFIDDLGKEVKELNVFGTVSKPIIDLFALRYETGAWTLATANYNLDTFEQFYGKTISERMKEMFNIIPLKGQSRRK